MENINFTYSDLDKSKIYEPSEDTFLLLDALEKDLNFIKAKNPLICLEIGCGSGMVITTLAKNLGLESLYFAVDVNLDACKHTKRVATQNNVLVNCLSSDLAANFLPRLYQQIDVILFNPPYVVTPSDEIGTRDLQASWAGGNKGREVINRFFPLLNELLSEKGVAYMVVIKENDIDDITTTLKTRHQISTCVFQSARAGREHLSILKLTRC